MTAAERKALRAEISALEAQCARIKAALNPTGIKAEFHGVSAKARRPQTTDAKMIEGLTEIGDHLRRLRKILG